TAAISAVFRVADARTRPVSGRADAFGATTATSRTTTRTDSAPRQRIRSAVFYQADGQHLVLNVTTGTKRARAARKSWWALARRSAGLDSTPHGAWRSLVAHPLWERKVAGSNPAAPIRHH